MENTNRDTAAVAAPQHNWQHPETNESYTTDHSHYIGDDAEELSIYAMASSDDPDPVEKDDDDDDSQDANTVESGDWGHVDPAEGNSPFPDSTDPSGPGSAV